MMKQKICAWIVFSLFFLLSANTASAHAYIIRSDPAAQQQVSGNLKQVKIQFDEKIQPTFFSLDVLDQSGHRVDTNQVRTDPHNPAILENYLNRRLPTGYYWIKWKVISADGHPVNGIIAFQVGHPGRIQSPPPDTAAAGNLPSADNLAIRWILYSGLSFYLGLLFFLKFIYTAHDLFLFKRRTMKIALNAAAGILLFGVMLSLPLQVTLNAGVSWLQSLNVQSLKATLFSTSFGTLWFVQLAILILCFLSHYWLFRSRSDRTAHVLWTGLIFLMLVFALSKAWIGHAASVNSIPIRILAVSADFLHLSSASVWLGSLICILFLPGLIKQDHPAERQKMIYRQTINRFSPFALTFVALILLSGVIGSVIHLPTLRSLYTSLYGWLLLIKAALLGVMLLFALYSFLRVRRRPTQFLKRSVIGELAVGLAVLLAAAALSNSPPPIPDRILKSSQGTAALQASNQSSAEAGGYDFKVKVTPGKVGGNTISLAVTRKGKPAADLQQAVLTIKSLEMDMGSTKVQYPLKELGKGSVPVNDTFIMSGRYLIRIHALTNSFQDLDKDIIVKINN
ncbi:copper resistance protein CopC [Sporolactobacillus sp. KGMB 08714]|uniref:copper resistance protein CopC n=1 Tax=Sporolactobacillus sp. KGMB 08714 TaxID=3064704 RepID=UPI002FBE498D